MAKAFECTARAWIPVTGTQLRIFIHFASANFLIAYRGLVSSAAPIYSPQHIDQPSLARCYEPRFNNDI